MEDRANTAPPADTEPTTVRELLLQTIDAPRIGHGSAAEVFNLHFPGLEQYVLRSESVKNLRKFLGGTTALIPVDQLITGVHIGQPLLQIGEDTSLLPRQKGISLDKLFQELHHDSIHTHVHEKAWVEVMQRIYNLSSVKRGENPFISVFEKLYAAAHSGKQCDLTSHNLFIDEGRGKLELIDQLAENWRFDSLHPDRSARKIYDESVGNIISIFNAKYAYRKPRTPEWEDRQILVHHLQELVYDANRHVLAAHANDKPGEYHGLAFADVSDVKAVSLDDPPDELVKRLNEIISRGNIPVR